jgi:hypothetical protein
MIAGAAACCGDELVVRPWLLRWGASDQEADGPGGWSISAYVLAENLPIQPPEGR